ncbi:MAG TPA: hypothetical protein PLE96_00510 [bacterium]|nr:hypothetical protein [bacterium]
MGRLLPSWQLGSVPVVPAVLVGSPVWLVAPPPSGLPLRDKRREWLIAPAVLLRLRKDDGGRS